MAKLNLAVFQSDNCLADKTAQLEKLTHVAQQAATNQSRLLLCPESFMTGYYVKDQLAELAESADGQFISQACYIAKTNNIALVFGYAERSVDGLYNSAIVINHSGQVISNFRKLHLPGEFEKSNYKPGSDFVEFNIEGIKASILICYDSEYPEAVRKLALAGTELLLVPTALSKVYAVVAQKVIPARAFENGIYIAYADCCGSENGWEFAGLSCIVDPFGNDLAKAGETEEIIYAQIDTDNIKTAQSTLPYLQELRPELYLAKGL